jgi:hypothetical protein
MGWAEVSKTLFYVMAGVLSLWVANSIDKMSNSVEDLNVKIAVVVERLEAHEKRLDKLENH